MQGSGNERAWERWGSVEHQCRNVMVQTGKRVEDSDETTIRMYEVVSSRTSMEVVLGRPTRRIWVANRWEEKPITQGATRFTLVVNS